MQYSTDAMIASKRLHNILFSADHQMSLFQLRYKEQSKQELQVVNTSMQTGYLMLPKELNAYINDCENK